MKTCCITSNFVCFFSFQQFRLENSEETSEKLLERAKRFGNQLDHSKPKQRLNLTLSTINNCNDVSYLKILVL